VQGICFSSRKHPSSSKQHSATLAVVSKCHNPRCSAQFRYFGEGKLYEFTPDSIRETSQLYWLCDRCSQTHSLERDSDGEVQLVPKHKRRSAYSSRLGRAS
jgi:hypothetical protein